MIWKAHFTLSLKLIRTRKNFRNPQDYTLERNESFAFGQKPVEIHTFNDQEEKEINEKVEKRKRKRQEVAEKNKAPKAQKKVKKDKEDEEKLLERLRTINTEFKDIQNNIKINRK